MDNRDKGESAPESASSRGSGLGLRSSVRIGGGRRGDLDDLESIIVWLSMAVVFCGGLVSAEAAGAEACEVDALDSVIATRGGRGFKGEEGVAISTESASGGSKMMSAGS